jgi:hypothetical protein
MKHTVEISVEAAYLLIGNDEKTWHDFKQFETYEQTTYKTNGVFVFAVYNYVSSKATQYYVQDINY